MNLTNKVVEIKDHFIVSCRSDRLRRKLLREAALDLPKLMEICRSEETSKQQGKEMKMAKINEQMEHEVA